MGHATARTHIIYMWADVFDSTLELKIKNLDTSAEIEDQCTCHVTSLLVLTASDDVDRGNLTL